MYNSCSQDAFSQQGVVNISYKVVFSRFIKSRSYNIWVHIFRQIVQKWGLERVSFFLISTQVFCRNFLCLEFYCDVKFQYLNVFSSQNRNWKCNSYFIFNHFISSWNLESGTIFSITFFINMWLGMKGRYKSLNVPLSAVPFVQFKKR